LRVIWQGDKSSSFLRAARAGDAEKVSKYLRNTSVDVNTCNDVRSSVLLGRVGRLTDVQNTRKTQKINIKNANSTVNVSARFYNRNANTVGTTALS